MMRLLIAVCVLALLHWSAVAHEFEMKVGQDTFVFDYNYDGRTIKVHEVLDGEPYSDLMESLAHEEMAVGNIMEAVPEAFNKPGLALKMAGSGEIGLNAFAAIFRGKRYVVMGAIHSDYTAMQFVMGHELGHHICGHTAGMLRNDPWAKELEADRFAGFAVRQVEKRDTGWGINLARALEYASQLFSVEGSPSHPPLQMRINAIIEGYKNGSPCVQRRIMPIPQTEIGGAGFRTAEPLWRHNESTMRLIASGAARQFLYEAPRDGLREVGVKKGTLLFKGKKDGDSYSGTAYVFTRCGPLPYAVSGPVSADHRKVTMQGRMPIPGSGCSIAGYRDATLMFTFVGD